MSRTYDFAVFDCDGVILQSNAIKSNAFAEALTGEPDDLVQAFVEYHKANGGVSRYQKFAHYFENMRGISSPQAEMERALKRYAEIVRQGLMNCPTIPGVENFLMDLHVKSIPCVVNSGGDEAELQSVLAARELDKYFALILGSPATKTDNMRRLRDRGFLIGSGVMFGDSRSDYLAAQEFGLEFVFVTYETEWKKGFNECKISECTIIRNFLTNSLLVS
ncbi:MAG: HAD family hydrolase [Geobacter sp.]|nr:MAG: HAD family hydrolase [Geobacter sp.]